MANSPPYMFIDSAPVFFQCSVQSIEILSWVGICSVVLQLTTSCVVSADITNGSNEVMSSNIKQGLSNEASDVPPSCQCLKCQHDHHFQCCKTETQTTSSHTSSDGSLQVCFMCPISGGGAVCVCVVGWWGGGAWYWYQPRVFTGNHKASVATVTHVALSGYGNSSRWWLTGGTMQ